MTFWGQLIEWVLRWPFSSRVMRIWTVIIHRPWSRSCKDLHNKFQSFNHCWYVTRLCRWSTSTASIRLGFECILVLSRALCVFAWWLVKIESPFEMMEVDSRSDELPDNKATQYKTKLISWHKETETSSSPLIPANKRAVKCNYKPQGKHLQIKDKFWGSWSLPQ